MVCKICPTRKHCWDKGSCETCEFGKALEKLSTKNKKLTEKNKALEVENRRLKEQVEILLHPTF